VKEELGVTGDSLAPVKAATEEACVQKKLEVESLAVGKEKSKRSLYKLIKNFSGACFVAAHSLSFSLFKYLV